MSCRVVYAGEGRTAIICGRGMSQRRICDICDHPASGPKDRLRDGTAFDGCVTCRRRVQLGREAAAAGTLIDSERRWLLHAAEHIHAAYAIAVPAAG